MKKILLIYPPFCTPASPPYSLAKIFAFLKENNDADINPEILDLNVLFHNLMFPNEAAIFRFLKRDKINWEQYGKIVHDYSILSAEIYSKNNKLIMKSLPPDCGPLLLENILAKKPDYAAFSIVYSSQAFYAYYLIDELKKKGIKTIIGGPGVNQKLKKICDAALSNELELLEYVSHKKSDHNCLKFEKPIDFSIFNEGMYFTPEPVIPIRTANACYYQRCAFCTHHQFSQYYEYPIAGIENSLSANKAKYVFLVDDLIHKKRLLEIAKITKKRKIKWMCQLKPTNDLDKLTLKTLYDSGLKVIFWGVESGSERVLKLMDKGTNTRDIEIVLKNSHKLGIKNALYIIFGFPTETKEEFLETKEFLNKNSEYIDLISTSIFGLQKNSRIYLDPKKYGISKIIEEKRSLLDEKITYEVSSGFSQSEVIEFFRNHKKSLEKLNKYPKQLNFFREHMLVLT